MLHVRVVSPAALTGRLADQLTASPGVQNLVVQPGAATRPDGDSVQFDLHDEAANPVFRDLRGLGLDRAGAICVERVDATLADQAPTGGHGAIVRERAPVWEMVEATIRAGAACTPSFYILLVAAGLIGAVGILTNSQILIVGAMVVGPEYSAIIAVALGISKGAGARYGTACSPCCGDSWPPSGSPCCSASRSGRRARPRPRSSRARGRFRTSSTPPTCIRSSSPSWPGSWAWYP